MSQRKKSIGRSSCVIFCLLFALVMILFSFLGAFLCHSPSSANTLFCQKTPVVVLDAGHGGEDGGAVGINGVYEKDLNLSIASKISSLLTACNVPTIMTRSEDVLLYDKSSDYQGQKKIQDLSHICDSWDHRARSHRAPHASGNDVCLKRGFLVYSTFLLRQRHSSSLELRGKKNFCI